MKQLELSGNGAADFLRRLHASERLWDWSKGDETSGYVLHLWIDGIPSGVTMRLNPMSLTGAFYISVPFDFDKV